LNKNFFLGSSASIKEKQEDGEKIIFLAEIIFRGLHGEARRRG